MGLAVPLNSLLVLLLLEDRGSSVRYLAESDLRALGLSPEAARGVALENLRLLRDSMLVESRDGRYRVPGRQEYESSLALDEAWLKGPRFGLRGDPVVGIPSRGAIFITDRRSTESLGTLRGIVAQMHAEAGGSALSPALFVWHQGALQPLSEESTSR
jgi:uncharacterized protein YtpQ (UPF0354 family)